MSLRLFENRPDLYPTERAATLGSSNQPTTQTFPEPQPHKNYRVPELRLSARPNSITVGTVFSSPRSGVLYNPGDLVEFRATHRENFKSNKAGRWLSPASAKAVQDSIHWLVQGSKQKGKPGKRWRLSMITLTLPAPQAHLDSTLNALALNQFLVQMRRYGMNNYVWDREPQQNGSVHWHISTDRYIDSQKIRRTWNSIMRKLGYIERYRRKHLKMSVMDYCRAYSQNYTARNGLSAVRRCAMAYIQGRAKDWQDPNSTDVRAVRSAKSLARYMAKHAVKISKPQPPVVSGQYSRLCPVGYGQQAAKNYALSNRRTTGRKWGRSQSISAISRAKVYITGRFSDLSQVMERAKEALKGQYFEFIGDKFTVLYFEPLKINFLTEAFRKQFAAVNYAPG